MRTSDCFKKEIDYIKNDFLKEITIKVLDSAPECIQTIPASSSGKYHPKADLGEGGLVRHIRTVTALAYSLINTDIFKNFIFGHLSIVKEDILDIYKDCVIVSCLLHDCMKPDDTPEHRTLFDHPLRAAKLFEDVITENAENYDKNYIDMIYPMIYTCIASHMGEFNKVAYINGVVLPKPMDNLTEFVHMCDYVASRKFFDFNFDVYEGR